jgi:hypothetical protein
VFDLPQFIFDRAMAEKPIFVADEIARWPEGLFALLTGYELVRRTENASAAVCDACGHDHVEPIVMLPLPDGAGFRAYIECPHEGRVSIPLDRLHQWMLDVPKLIAMTGWSPPVRDSDRGSFGDPICLTTAEVAKYIGVSDRTVREWRKNGKLVVVEDDKCRLYFSKSSLEVLRQARQ